jgi:hypothetical protein
MSNFLRAPQKGLQQHLGNSLLYPRSTTLFSFSSLTYNDCCDRSLLKTALPISSLFKSPKVVISILEVRLIRISRKVELLESFITTQSAIERVLYLSDKVSISFRGSLSASRGDKFPSLSAKFLWLSFLFSLSFAILPQYPVFQAWIPPAWKPTNIINNKHMKLAKIILGCDGSSG